MKARKIFFWWAIICNQLCVGSDFILSQSSSKQNVISGEASSKKGFTGVENNKGVAPSLSQQPSSSQQLVSFNLEDADLLNLTEYMQRVMFNML